MVNELIISHFFSTSFVSLEDRSFPSLTYKFLMQKEKKSKKTHSHLNKNYSDLSRFNDRSTIQESCSIRNVLRTRDLAKSLINDEGRLDKQKLDQTIEIFSQSLFSLAPEQQHDSIRQQHILKILLNLKNDLLLVHLLQQIVFPFGNYQIEKIIRQTLKISSHQKMTDAHARQAVLSALLCYLRQNVGSCFATAPAEIVHDEQPHLFLKDMIELLTTSRLKRVFEGNEYTVPMSPSWGNGDLKKPIILYLTLDSISPEIWLSPGLITALNVAGCFSHATPLKEKIEWLKKQIFALVSDQRSSPYLIVTPEKIIQVILLKLNDLTVQQLKEYEHRPFTNSIHLQSLIRVPPKQKAQESFETRCQNYLKQFETAKEAFKELADNPLLKVWEYTVASFAETKYHFSQWNLYSSLGLGTQEVNGIGQTIYQIIQTKLNEVNLRIQNLQQEYEILFTQVKTLEGRLKRAASEEEAKWLKSDYQMRTVEFYFLQEQIQDAQHLSKNLVNLYDTLYESYTNLFKDYFQEVYDATMQEVISGPFDDSPAGFRLLYKHGRTHSSQWTLIHNQHDFIEALNSFFIATETQIAHEFESEEIKKILSQVVSALIALIKTPEFLVSAFHRMAIAHKTPLIQDPLNNLEKIEKKPWVYTSGGVMDTLVSTYYGINGKPASSEKWVESEIELLTFIVDVMKQMPYRIFEAMINNRQNSLLMYSPTHAFTLKPFLMPFKEIWQNEIYTFTFVRDAFVIPAEIFVSQMIFNQEVIDHCLQQLSEIIHPNFQPRFKEITRAIRAPLTPLFFREQLLNALANDVGLNANRFQVLSADEIDHFLYAQIPFFPSYQLKDKIKAVFDFISSSTYLPEMDFEKIWQQIPEECVPYGKIIGATQLIHICKSLLSLCLGTSFTSIDYCYYISKGVQHLGFAMPEPVIFADTNWVKDLFAFVVNPGPGKLELWRMDYTGLNAYPMSSWKQWVDGSKPAIKWGIYFKPYEYGQGS